MTKQEAKEIFLRHITDAFKSRMVKRSFHAGETVVRKGDPADTVYLLLTGTLRVINEFSDGQRFAFANQTPPDFIGDLEVFAGAPAYSATNEAMTRCTMLVMSATTFREWMKSDVTLTYAAASMLAYKMYPTSDENGSIKFQPSLIRLSRYIHRHIPEKSVPLFILQRNRQQIADAIGLSIKTVNRCVNRLKEDGLIGISHGKISLTPVQQKQLEAASIFKAY